MSAHNLLPSSSLLKIYYAHIFSHIMYSLAVWGMMCPKSLQNSLYRLQTNCAKLIAKMPKTYDAEILYKNFQIIQLRDMIYLEQRKLGNKASHKLLPKPLLDMFNT